MLRILFITLSLSSFALQADEVTTTTQQTTTTTTMPAAPVSLPGGYSTVEVTDPGVQSAANFATAQLSQGVLVKIVSAQKQVVAGINYKMTLIVAQNGIYSQYNVVVFTPLPTSGQAMQLTDVQAMGVVDAPSGT